MKTTLLLTPIILFLCGCATPIEYVRKNPKKEAVVRYIRPTSTDAKSDYTAKLKQEATDFCEGDYKIKEEHHALSDASTPANVDIAANPVCFTDSDSRLMSYDYVEFICK